MHVGDGAPPPPTPPSEAWSPLEAEIRGTFRCDNAAVEWDVGERVAGLW